MRNNTLIILTTVLLWVVAGQMCSAGSDVDVAALVRAVRESENWIRHVDSLLIRMESKWTPASAGASSSPRQRGTGMAVVAGCNSCVESEDECLVPAPKPNSLPQAGPIEKGILEYAIDGTRVRFLDEQPGRWRKLRVWDGKQLIAHEISFPDNRESYYLNWTAQGSFEQFMAYRTSWPKSQPHSFWWDRRDVDELLSYYGRPEEFVLTGQGSYHGVDCHTLEFYPKELRGIMVGQSHRCDSGPQDRDEYGYIGEVRGLADQSYRWYVGTKDHRLYGLAWLISKKPHTEHWMLDYKEVAPGCWFPMTQGYELYDRDDGGKLDLLAQRHLRVLEARVNERLPDDLFQIELKKGVQVIDSRSGRTVHYTCEPDPPELVGKALPAFEDIKLRPACGHANNGKGFPKRERLRLGAPKTLVCFWDVQQRPSRHCIRKLAGEAENLGEHGISIIAIQASKVDEKLLDDWLQEQKIALPVGVISGDVETARYAWGVRALPWLILTDGKHVVSAAGFGVHALANKVAAVSDGQRPPLRAAKLMP